MSFETLFVRPASLLPFLVRYLRWIKLAMMVIQDSVLEAESNAYVDLQTLAFAFISALRLLPASRQLHSCRGGKNLCGDLSRLMSAVSFDDFDIKQIIPLLKAVLGKEPDKAIWDKVYAAITESTALTVIVEPITPPQPGPPLTASSQQTPWTFNTGSFTDTSELRKDVDPILKSEVEDNFKIDHPDVFTTFFGQIP